MLEHLRFSIFYFVLCILYLFPVLPCLSQSPEEATRGKIGGGTMLRGGKFQSLGEKSAIYPTSSAREYRPAAPRIILPGVRRLVPGEYPTIQVAIDSSVDGDTVLISEGTYYENIRYKGKAIVVASLYLIDGDTTHITQTIINGSNPANPFDGSAVSFIDGEDTTSVLYGLTITGGTGTLYNIDGNWYRCGGGVFCKSAGARLTRNLIVHNRIISDGAVGGGLAVLNNVQYFQSVIIEYNHICDNYLQSISETLGGDGGGIAIVDIATGGISSRIIGNVIERDTVLATNWANGGGLSLWKDIELGISGVYPEANIQGNIFQDNVLNATNSAARGGGICIRWTADVTILENLFDNNVVISTSNYADGGGIFIKDLDITGYGRKMIMRNRIINNCTNVGGNGQNSNGGGIHLLGTLATVASNEIADNRAIGDRSFGGGICIDWTSFRLENNIITRNYSDFRGGGVDVWQDPQEGIEQLLVNNTIYDNNAQDYGGGLGVTDDAKVVALNNILWADTASYKSEVYVFGGGWATIFYSDVQGGWHIGEGNISKEPMLRGENLILSDSSSCIGAGIAEYNYGSTLISCPPTDFMGNPRPNPSDSLPDMGACESPLASPIVGLKTPLATNLPVSFDLKQNYPNPFNPVTAIAFNLPKTSQVTLKIFNVLGEEVATLVSRRLTTGKYTYEWDGSNVASGVYLYRIEAEGFVETRKMVLMR